MFNVGDLVIRSYGLGGRQRDVRRVERVTKTQAVLEGVNVKFRLSDGRAIGDNYYHSRIYTATPEKLEEVRQAARKSELVSRFKDTLNWEALPLPVLEQVAQVVMDWQESVREKKQDD